MTKYEIAVRLLAEYCDCPSKDGITVDLPMKWCENYCKYDGDDIGHEETLQCWEKVINDRYEAQDDVLKCSELPNGFDLISRQAAIDALDKRFDSIPMELTTEILILRKDLRELPSTQPEQRWIPCEERLPEEDNWLGGSGKQFSNHVLISIVNNPNEYKWIDISYTVDGEWALELPGHCKILAWMPLPEPYKEEKK